MQDVVKMRNVSLNTRHTNSPLRHTRRIGLFAFMGPRWASIERELVLRRKAMYRTPTGNVRLSGIGRMAEVRNVPRLAWFE